MDKDPEAGEGTMRSRDARSDGWFFCAVVTTVSTVAHSVRELDGDHLVLDCGDPARPLACPLTQVDHAAYRCGCW
jgi:hypothetical protein